MLSRVSVARIMYFFSRSAVLLSLVSIRKVRGQISFVVWIEPYPPYGVPR